MIIVTIGSVKLRFETIEEAVAVFHALKPGTPVTEEYHPHPTPNTFHPAKSPTLEIAVIDAEVTPWPEKKKEAA